MFQPSSSIDESTGLVGVLSIKSSYEIFENREFLNHIFLHLDVRSIVLLSGVSKSFLGVGRSNVLWSEVLKKPKQYFNKDLFRVSDFERLDMRNGNIYSKIKSEMKKSYFQSIEVRRVDGEKKEKDGDRSSKQLHSIISRTIFLFFYLLIGTTSIMCPPFGILVHGFVAYFKYVEIDRRETKGSWMPLGSMLDISGSFLLTLCGCSPFFFPCCLIQFFSTCCWCCCVCCVPGCLCSTLTSFVCGCVHSQNYAIHHMLLWLGRFYFFDEVRADPIAELFTSPSIWILGSILGFDKITC